MKNVYKFIGLILLSITFLVVFACQKKTDDANKPNTNSTANVASSTPTTQIATQRAKTPTEAYKLLYEYVKAKNTEAIKSMMTKNTILFAEGQAARTNSPIEKVFENGFTGSTFSETLPEIRDERVKENMAALEVKNVKENRWEDLPFMLEDGGWKLAVGEAFGGTYKSPGPGQSFKEQQAANKTAPNMAPSKPTNGNTATMPQPPVGK
jgi:hypothetical protein